MSESDKRRSGRLTILLCLAGLLFWGFFLDWKAYLSTDQPLGSSDLLRQYIPFRILGLKHWHEGNWNFWLPEANLGNPYIGAVMDTWWYPTSILIALLKVNVPIVLFFNWQTLIHIAVLSWGVFAVCRALGASNLPAFLAGISVITCGPMVHNTYAFGVPFTQIILAWTPWIIFGVVNWMRSGSWTWALFLSLVMGLQCLAGMVQYVFFTYLAFTLFSVVFFLRKEHRAEPGKLFSQWLAIYLLSVGIGFAQLYPTYEFSIWSVRKLTGVEWHHYYPTALESYWNLLFPSLAGNWQTGTHHELPRGLDTKLYASTFSILLFLCALVRPLHFFRKSFFMALAIFTVMGMVIAAGDYNPVSDWISTRTILKNFRANGRILDLAIIFLIIGAACVLQEFLSETAEVLKAWLAKTFIVLALLFALGAWHTNSLVQPDHQQFLVQCIQEGALLGGMAFCILLLHVFSRFKRSWILPLLMIVFVGIESFYFRSKTPYPQKFSVIAKDQPELSGLRKSDPETWRYRVQVVGANFVDAYPLYHGFFNCFNYMATPLGDTQQLSECFTNDVVGKMLGLKKLWIVPESHEERAPDLTSARARQFTNSLAPVFLAADARIFKEPEELVNHICSRQFDPAREVCLLESQANHIRSQNHVFNALRQSAPNIKESRILDLRMVRNNYVIQLALVKPTLLVLSQAYFPGWEAVTSGGHVIKSTSGNLGLNVFLLPEGIHTLNISYDPRVEWMSCTISILFLGMTLSVLCFLVSKRKPASVQSMQTP